MTNREWAKELDNQIMLNGRLRQGDRSVGLIERALDEAHKEGTELGYDMGQREMGDRDDIERELLSMAHERDKWKALAGELAAAGNNISDAIEIPHDQKDDGYKTTKTHEDSEMNEILPDDFGTNQISIECDTPYLRVRNEAAKWKGLAMELTKTMQLIFEEWPEKITPCHRQMETMLAKAREAGL